MRRSLDEKYYGFGGKTGSLDKHGRRMRIRNSDAFGYNAEAADPLYKYIPFYIALWSDEGKSPLAYGIFYDTTYDCEFDMGSDIDNYYDDYRVFSSAGSDLDYYLMLGPSIEEVVEQYTALTGRIQIPPRWTLDYLGTFLTYSYFFGTWIDILLV